MDKLAAIHINTNMPHQVEFAAYLSNGFSANGWKSFIDNSRGGSPKAAVNVVLGPHYALKGNLADKKTRDNILYLDRCFWGNPSEVVSLAWLSPDGEGEKIFQVGCDAERDKPELQPWKESEGRALVLCDYSKNLEPGIAEKHFDYVEYRPHPTKGNHVEKLRFALERNDIAIGFLSSSMVTAAIAGLPVVCMNEHSAVGPIASRLGDEIIRPNREQWLNDLSYMNWDKTEIESGEALRFLLCQ